MDIPEDMTDAEFWAYITPQRPSYLSDYSFELTYESDDQSSWSGQVRKIVAGGFHAPILGVYRDGYEEEVNYVVITCLKDKENYFGFVRLAYDDEDQINERALTYLEMRDSGVVPAVKKSA